MAYKITKWDFSDRQVQDTEVPEGLRAIKIENAWYDDEDYTYNLECIDLSTEVEFKLRYWLQSRDGATGQIVDNKTSIGVLNSLGRAIFGDDSNVGVPCPGDIIGAVCIANIKLRESKTSGKKYPSCYNYMAAYETEAWASEIEQYFRQAE